MSGGQDDDDVATERPDEVDGAVDDAPTSQDGGVLRVAETCTQSCGQVRLRRRPHLDACSAAFAPGPWDHATVKTEGVARSSPWNTLVARAHAALQDLMRELDAMPHTPSLSQLQHPAFAVVNGELVAYDDVKVHISAEALTRALSVFEGMKGYWDLDSQEFAIRSPRQHYDRLRRSATVLHIPVDFSYDEFRDSCLDLARALLTVDRDMWFRTTMYVVEGHWGEGTRADLVVTGFHQTKDPIPPMSLTVSSWRRSGDSQLPYRVKASANYVVARQARIEASERGFDDAVLLNDAGRVAEATGSCVVALRDGVVCTPPAYEGRAGEHHARRRRADLPP